MTIWTNEPSDANNLSPTRLIRTRPGKPLTALITSDQLLGCYVHFWRGRTTPCNGATCEACNDNRLKRWYGWVSACTLAMTENVILEITAACCDPIKDYVRTHGRLRGAQLFLERATAKQNSRLIARITESKHSPDVLPAALDVVHVLEHIWETHHSRHTDDAKAQNDLPGQLHMFPPATG